MYQEILLDHYKNPRHQGKIAQPDFSSGQFNPSCGDAVCVQGCVKNDLLVAAAFEGKGCVISQAVTSLLLSTYVGKIIEEIMALGADDVRALIHMPLGPTRLKCAMLGLMALQEGIKKYQAK